MSMTNNQSEVFGKCQLNEAGATTMVVITTTIKGKTPNTRLSSFSDVEVRVYTMRDLASLSFLA